MVTTARPMSSGASLITTGEFARSTIAFISASGSRHETGCGMAPIFQAA